MATTKSSTPNARDAIGNGHRGQIAAALESTLSNACNVVGNYSILTTCDKRIGSSFYNRITIIATIINRVSFNNFDIGYPFG